MSMNMVRHSSSSSFLLSNLKLGLILSVCVASAACASQQAPAPAAAAPPSQAFQQASTGVAEPQAQGGQAGSDDVVFVDQGRKAAPTTHDDVPATSLKADTQTARPQR
jgi:hypothetical protein